MKPITDIPKYMVKIKVTHASLHRELAEMVVPLDWPHYFTSYTMLTCKLTHSRYVHHTPF